MHPGRCESQSGYTSVLIMILAQVALVKDFVQTDVHTHYQHRKCPKHSLTWLDLNGSPVHCFLMTVAETALAAAEQTAVAAEPVHGAVMQAAVVEALTASALGSRPALVPLWQVLLQWVPAQRLSLKWGHHGFPC